MNEDPRINAAYEFGVISERKRIGDIVMLRLNGIDIETEDLKSLNIKLMDLIKEILI